jgi:hypothetical protein
MIHLFPIGSIKNTVFEKADCIQFLNQHQIGLTENIQQADIFIIRTCFFSEIKMNDLILSKLKSGTPVLLWTHEPRFCPTDEELIYVEGIPVHVMNVYTRNVYFSNFTFYGNSADRLLSAVDDVSFSPKPIVGLATYVLEERQTLILQGINIDLGVKRQNLLYEGYCDGCVDIYGVGWPLSLHIPESRGLGWHKKKIGILQQYQFNICMENTAFDYYCTEKIWDSIKGFCLPVYSGFNNRIYETFPKNSFIDYDDFSDNRELLLYIKSMSRREYLDRLNVCIQTFNEVYTALDFAGEREKAFTAIVEKVSNIYRARTQ